MRVGIVGCGLIGNKRAAALGADTLAAVCDRDASRAQALAARFPGAAAVSLDELIARSEAVIVATTNDQLVPVADRAVSAGKHVLVEKPAFPLRADYETVRDARDLAQRVVCVGENDHYKPLAVTLRRLLAEDAIGDLVLAQFTTVAHRPKSSDDWRNDETMAGGDAFFEEGIHWLHLAGSLGPTITRISAFRPALSDPGAAEGDRRAKSMLVAFEYDGGGVGALYYSREIPSLLRGLRWSKLFGRKGVITFESNGGVVMAPGRRVPRVITTGFSDIRGYRAMYLDFARAIRSGSTPEMSLERAMADHALMEQVYGLSS
jgi:predicted dehydrogenase